MDTLLSCCTLWIRFQTALRGTGLSNPVDSKNLEGRLGTRMHRLGPPRSHIFLKGTWCTWTHSFLLSWFHMSRLGKRLRKQWPRWKGRTDQKGIFGSRIRSNLQCSPLRFLLGRERQCLLCLGRRILEDKLQPYKGTPFPR